MDLLFLVKGNTLLLPYQKVVDDMRQVLSIGFHSKVARSGYEHAQLSKHLLNSEPTCPRHILTVLAEELNVREFKSEEEKQSLYRRLKEEDAQLPKLIDLNELAKTLVKGVKSEVPVPEDETMETVQGSEKTPVAKVDWWTGKDSKNKADIAQLKMTEPEVNQSPQLRALQRLESPEPTTKPRRLDELRLVVETEYDEIQMTLPSVSAGPRSTPQHFDQMNLSAVQRRMRQLNANVVERTPTEPGSQLGHHHPAFTIAFQADDSIPRLTLEHTITVSLFLKNFKKYKRRRKAIIGWRSTRERKSEVRAQKSSRPGPKHPQSTWKRPTFGGVWASETHKKRVIATLMEQAGEPKSQVRLETPSLVKGMWIFPPSTSPARRSNFGEKSEGHSLKPVTDEEKIESEGTTRGKYKSQGPGKPQLSPNAQDKSYEHSLFDWLFDPDPQPLRGIWARDSSHRPVGGISASQWVPRDSENELQKDEDWDDEHELGSLKQELKRLFPDQTEEKDWGLKNDKNSFEERRQRTESSVGKPEKLFPDRSGEKGGGLSKKDRTVSGTRRNGGPVIRGR